MRPAPPPWRCWRNASRSSGRCRPGCSATAWAALRTGVVANVVVPHPEYLRFAAHYGFRPDFCEAMDPESKGVVENLVGYAKSDLVVPANAWGGRVAEGNRAARLWGIEVNGRLHSETQAVPDARLSEERALMRTLPGLRPPLCRGELRKVGRLQTVRFASARYSLPRSFVGKKVEVAVVDEEVVIAYEGHEVERHPLMAPGESSIKDEHYPGSLRPTPAPDSGKDRNRTDLHRPRSGRRDLPARRGGRGHLEVSR
jgi:hypothetical protein